MLFPGRWPDTDVLWGVPAIRHYPYAGSAIYYWDTGPVGAILESDNCAGGPCFAGASPGHS